MCGGAPAISEEFEGEILDLVDAGTTNFSDIRNELVKLGHDEEGATEGICILLHEGELEDAGPEQVRRPSLTQRQKDIDPLVSTFRAICRALDSVDGAKRNEWAKLIIAEVELYTMSNVVDPKPKPKDVNRMSSAELAARVKRIETRLAAIGKEKKK